MERTPDAGVVTNLKDKPVISAPGFSSPAHLICSAHDAVAAYQQLSGLPIVTLHEFLGIDTAMTELGDLASIRKACRVDGQDCRDAQNIVRATFDSRMLDITSTRGGLGVFAKEKSRTLVRCADALTDNGALSKYLGTVVPEMELAAQRASGGSGWLKKHLQGVSEADNGDNGDDEAQVDARAMAMQAWCKEQGFVFVRMQDTA